MNGIVLAPHYNRKTETNPRDATGAFQPYARAFATAHALPAPVLFENNDSPDCGLTDAQVRQQFFAAFDSVGNLDVIAYFGHGSVNGLGSARLRAADAQDFATLILRKSNPSVTVILYACSAGTPGGFADSLSSYLGGTSDGSVEWEGWIRRPTRAVFVKLHGGGIIGVYRNETDARAEQGPDQPWRQGTGWERWLTRSTQALRVGVLQSGIIGVFRSRAHAEAERQRDSGAPWQKIRYRRRVYGHTTVKHTVWNPDVTRFPGGSFVVPPDSALFPTWRRALRHTDLWSRFPFMTDGDIHEELA